LTRRSAKKRSALRVSAHFFTPKICTCITVGGGLRIRSAVVAELQLDSEVLAAQEGDDGLEVIERGLAVMDTTALTLCMDNDLPLLVFNMQDEANLGRILGGERVGTIVSGPSGPGGGGAA
jgi:hypothetical protein